MPEHQPCPVPAWAERERLGDLAWIGDNLHTFWPTACLGYQHLGRGAILTDTTVRIQQGEDEKYPFVYVTIADVQQYFAAQVVQMVQRYHPTQEFVAILLKEFGRQSSYQIPVSTATSAHR